jgi:sulfate adenylyltransferase
LVNRVAEAEGRAELLERCGDLPEVEIDRLAASDIELIATGAFSPLEGFIGREDYESVLASSRLASGLPWPIPVTLPVARDVVAGLKLSSEVVLVCKENGAKAVLHLEEVFDQPKEREAALVYGTTDSAHPGVARLYGRGEVLLSGKIALLSGPEHRTLVKYRHTPAETRAVFDERGWKRIAGFQTRNPIHRAHEYIQKCALEIVDGLFLHPLVGDTKAGDVPAEVSIRSYEVVTERYYPKERVFIGTFPAYMRYAGPREAVFHALVRKNYGCTHFIVGRDHAGVGSYYGPFDAHKIFESFDSEEVEIIPLFFDHTFYCHDCEGMCSPKTCPHPAGSRCLLSGRKVRELLAEGKTPPAEHTRPEVARMLVEAYRKTNGASGAGSKDEHPAAGTSRGTTKKGGG